MIKFALVMYSPIRRDLVDLTLAAITMVWVRHIGKPVQFPVTFCDRIFHQKGAMVDPNAAYHLPSRSFVFALKNLLHQWPEEAWPIQVVRVAAHEAMHAVQHSLGRVLTPDSLIALPAHHESPLEVEAHQESMDVLKGYIPTTTAPLPVGDREYPPPSVSQYEGQWEQARRQDLPFVIVSESAPESQQ